ncbi:MAG TPA: amidase family protein [Candidatus Binatia bacterium]
MRRRAALVALVALTTLALTPTLARANIIHEASIASLHKAIQNGKITCKGIIEAYLKRIEAFNGPCAVPGPDPRTLVPGYTGPSFDGYWGALRSDPTRKTVYGNFSLTNDGQLGALIAVNVRGQRSGTCPGACDVAGTAPLPAGCPTVCNKSRSIPDALEEAAALDARYGRRPPLKELPLYCIPFSAKDTIDSSQIRSTSGGDAKYYHDRAEYDATVIQRVREKGAILLAQANLNEYNAGLGSPSGLSNPIVGHNGSTVAGPLCNPYDTTRTPGSSSGGSGSSVGANLVVCSFCEETGGSCRNPANVNGAVVLMGSQGFYSKFGLSPVSRIRDRIAVICRSVDDVARVADAIVGYDPLSTESPVDYFNPKPESFTKLVGKTGDKKPLKGLRIGIVREHMVPWTPNDEDRVIKFNAELKVLRDLGAELVESVDPEYIARMGDDPTIPNMETDFNDAIAQILPYYMASYIFKTDSNGNPLFPSLYNYSSDRIKTSVDLFFGDLMLPASVAAGHLNLRRLQSFPGTPGEGKHSLNIYLRQRGDPIITDIQALADNSNFQTDKLLDPDDPLSHDPNWISSEYEDWQLLAQETTLDSPGLTERIMIREVMRQVIAKVMGDNGIDAFINPLSTLPPGKILGPGMPSGPGLRPSTRFPLSADAGIPEVVVPMGFSRVAYDPYWVVNPNNSNAVMTVMPTEPTILPEPGLPFGMSFWGGPGQEAQLVAIADAYENATNHRKPPKGYGPLPGEP